MCDPATIGLGIMSIVGGASAANVPKPPKAKLPALATKEAKSDTGAEILLGGDRSDDLEDETKETNKTNTKTTSESGLSTSAKRSGLSIL